MTRISSALPRCLLVLGAGLLLLTSMAWSADDKDQSDIDKRLDASAKVLNEIMATPDKAIPDKVMNDAKCVAVIPSLVKIAVGFGGSHGKGIATCRTESGSWSAPAPITITGGSWGLQLGGQAVDIVMIVTNDDGMQHLLSSKFKLGADASAAAGPVGRDAGADETRILYGSFVPFADILNGKVPPKGASEPFLAAVRRYSRQAREHGEMKPASGNSNTASR